jgi:hypothetical protein
MFFNVDNNASIFNMVRLLAASPTGRFRWLFGWIMVTHTMCKIVKVKTKEIISTQCATSELNMWLNWIVPHAPWNHLCGNTNTGVVMFQY